MAVNPYYTDIPAVSGLLTEQEKINKDQLNSMLDVIRYQMPTDYNPNQAMDINSQRKLASNALTARYAGQATPFEEYKSNESNALADKLSKISNNLTNAQSDYNASGVDFNRGLINNQTTNAFNQTKGNMMNTVDSAIKSRQANSAVTEIQRQANIEHINKMYSAKIEALKKEAEAARKRGDTSAWVSILGAIGTIVGAVATVYAGGVGGVAGGAAGAALGKYIGDQS